MQRAAVTRFATRTGDAHAIVIAQARTEYCCAMSLVVGFLPQKHASVHTGEFPATPTPADCDGSRVELGNYSIPMYCFHSRHFLLSENLLRCSNE